VTVYVCDCAHLWDGKLCTFCGHKGKKQHKYRAVPQRVCSGCSFVWGASLGIECPECKSVHSRFFASKRELERYGELRLVEKSGGIRNLELQPRFTFPFGGTYIADFAYIEEEQKICEDVKGVLTAAFRLKHQAMKHYYPDVELRIIR
jgi:hypothetical protein